MSQVTVPLAPAVVPDAPSQMFDQLDMAWFAYGGLDERTRDALASVYRSAYLAGFKAGAENTVQIIANGDTGLESVQRV